MKIESIRLRNFRGVKDQNVDFAAGITIIEGPNEAGKTSLTEALRLIRDVKANSRSREIRSVQPVGSDEGPIVELSLTTGPYHATYTKQWLKGPGKTELRLSGATTAQYTGDEAHLKFRQILEETLDLDLLTALDVVQGNSLEQARLASIQSLQNALGAEPSNESGDRLMDAIEEHYLRYFTATGKPAKILRETEEHYQGQLQVVANLEQAQKEIDLLSTQYDRTKELVGELKEELQRAVDEESEAQNAVKEVELVRDEIDHACEHEKQAQGQVDRALADKQRRQQLVADLTRRNEELEELKRQLEAASGHLDTSKAALAAVQSNSQRTQDQIKEQDQKVRDIEAALRFAQGRQKHDQLKERLGRARACQERLGELQTQLRRIHITEAQVEAIRNSEIELRVTLSALQAAAAAVTVTPHQEDLGITLNGERLDGPRTASVETAVAIEIPGWATITIVPGQAPNEIEEEVRAAKTKLDEALDSAKVHNLEEALSRRSQTLSIDAKIKVATDDLDRALDHQSLAELQEEFKYLAAELAPGETSGFGEDPSDGDNKDTGASVAELEQQLSDARQRLESIREEGEPVQDELRKALERFNEDSLRQAELMATQNVQGRETSTMSARLDQERLDDSDDAIGERLDLAEESLEKAGAKREEAENKLRELDTENIDGRLGQAQGKRRRYQADLENSHNQLLALKAKIEDRESQGIYDQLLEAKANLEATEHTWKRLRRDSAAVAMLRSTMARHQRQAQEHYVEPFRHRLADLGRSVYGADFEIEVSPQLEIVSRTLDGETIPFESLSSGTREQLSLLGRLACAQLVSPAEGAPLILDDTLSFADPRRLRDLAAVITKVGTQSQIIILTCDPSRTREIGDARVVRIGT